MRRSDLCGSPAAPANGRHRQVCAALAASARDHDLDGDGLRTAETAWEEYWAAIRPVEFTSAVEQHAGQVRRER